MKKNKNVNYYKKQQTEAKTPTDSIFSFLLVETFLKLNLKLNSEFYLNLINFLQTNSVEILDL